MVRSASAAAWPFAPAALDDFRRELRDRYGPVPEPAEWLLRTAELRLLAARWRVAGVHRVGRDIVLTYKSARLIKKLAERGGERFRVVDEKSAYYRLGPGDEEPPRLYEMLKRLLAT
jgi:transcription-repair coupling factor (superfamily II helicase)